MERYRQKNQGNRRMKIPVLGQAFTFGCPQGGPIQQCSVGQIQLPQRDRVVSTDHSCHVALLNMVNR